jgi:hypothetical protein
MTIHWFGRDWVTAARLGRCAVTVTVIGHELPFAGGAGYGID